MDRSSGIDMSFIPPIELYSSCNLHTYWRRPDRGVGLVGSGPENPRSGPVQSDLLKGISKMPLWVRHMTVR
jgi:hypothetical protein